MTPPYLPPMTLMHVNRMHDKCNMPSTLHRNSSEIRNFFCNKLDFEHQLRFFQKALMKKIAPREIGE